MQIKSILFSQHPVCCILLPVAEIYAQLGEEYSQKYGIALESCQALPDFHSLTSTLEGKWHIPCTHIMNSNHIHVLLLYFTTSAKGRSKGLSHTPSEGQMRREDRKQQWKSENPHTIPTRTNKLIHPKSMNKFTFLAYAIPLWNQLPGHLVPHPQCVKKDNNKKYLYCSIIHWKKNGIHKTMNKKPS